MFTFFIFFCRQLRVARIILHQNLFSSMLLNGIFVIAFKTIVMLNEFAVDSGPESIIYQVRKKLYTSLAQSS